MAAKPESAFTSSVHKHLPHTLHREKMHNPYRGGTWDMWYSGPKADLWVEYKFIVLPKRDTTIIKPDLSALQLEWGKKRLEEGRNLRVIIGCKEGGVILMNRSWENDLTTEQFKDFLIPRLSVAQHILQLTCA